MSSPFIGEVRMFGFNFSPRGNAFCQGQLLPIAQNQALFALLGTTYGGNGQTNFALPDLRSRVPVHAGNGAAGPGLAAVQLGEAGGVEAHTLLATQMPAHTHGVTATSSGPDAATPVANRWSDSGNQTYHTAATVNATMDALAIRNQGGNQPHTNIQPYLTINFSIALQGIFPSRS